MSESFIILARNFLHPFRYQVLNNLILPNCFIVHFDDSFSFGCDIPAIGDTYLETQMWPAEVNNEVLHVGGII